MTGFDHGVSGLHDEAVYQSFVLRIMNMAIEHIGQWVSRLIFPILTWIAKHGIVGQDHQPTVIPDLLIGLDPAEQAGVELPVGQEHVVVPDDQILFAVQLLQNALGRLGFCDGEVAEDIHLILPRDLRVPLLNHVIVHLDIVSEAATVHFGAQPVVEEMRISNV